MIGAEILIKSGDDCVYGKVRHNGDDIIDYVKEKGDKLFDVSFEDMWKEYYAWRIKDFTEISLKSEIESAFQKTGFKGKITKSDERIEQFSKTCYDLEEIIEKQDDGEDGFLCSYGDYHVMIDCDDKKVYVPNMAGDDMLELDKAIKAEKEAFEKEKEEYIKQQKAMLEATFGEQTFQTEREKVLDRALSELMGKIGNVDGQEIDKVTEDIDKVLATRRDKMIDVVVALQETQNQLQQQCGGGCGDNGCGDDGCGGSCSH